MEYLVFPFGKYKGVALTELPSTYIVLALEKFELPDELITELRMVLYGRLNVWNVVRHIAEQSTKKEFIKAMSELEYKSENQNTWHDLTKIQ
jgi:uncharacterized protein (DUF3820 family)